METLPHAEVQEHLVRDALKRHLALLVVLGVLFGAAGAFLASKQPREYTSEARVLITATTGNALSPDSATSSQRVTVAMVTEAALVDSPAIADSVAKSLGVTTDTAVKAMTASVPPNTQLVSIKYTANSATLAQRGAKAFADAYLAYRKGLSVAVVKTQVASLTAQDKDVSAKLAAAGRAAAVTDAKPDANAQVQLYASRLATIQNNLAAVNTTQTSPGALVDPPDLPPVTTSIIGQLLVPVAVVLGLLLGFVLALWRERRDDRIRGARDHDRLGVPLLAVVPGKGTTARALVDGGDDPVSESYRHARAGLLAARGSSGRVFGVAGATTGHPVADVALNLGQAIARAGYRTAVVDATAGHEDLGEVTGVESDHGFSDVLHSDIDVATIAVATRGLELVTRGGNPWDSRDLFHSEEMRRAVAAVGGAHDYSLLAASGATTAEGSGVAIASDGMILVVEERRTTHAQLGSALQRCREVGAPVLGVVVVPSSAKRWWSRSGRQSSVRTAARPGAESSEAPAAAAVS